MSNDDWGTVLTNHPIFTPPKFSKLHESLELSLNTLPTFLNPDGTVDNPAPSGRRQVMCMKDADLILASGSEIRMTSLGDAKASGGSHKSYKVLHTPNIQFDIHQICLSPNGKILAVSGAFQVAVVILPRSGFSKLVTSRVDCRSVQIGQYYHATPSSPPIAKIDWHPWGEAGSTLLVMTADGKLREYDTSVDPEEPQQTLSFVPERRRGAFAAEDDSDREVVSFTLGKGSADWGPLTVYAVLKCGDIFAICPYMPQNASIPSSYVHALECYVSAKQEFLSERGHSADESFSTIYDYQRKYVNGLVKQLPPGTAFPSSSRSLCMHPPRTLKITPLRQGPFLLQPAPPELDGNVISEATDITYVSFGGSFEDEESSDTKKTERLGIILLTFQDGRVDVCLDLEKVEAKWESKQNAPNCLPMLAVYESIDLGIISTLSTVSAPAADPKVLDLLRGNHPVLHLDPIHDDTAYIYHAFGVHVINLGPVLQSLAGALREDEDGALMNALQNPSQTSVQSILTTFSVERQASNPIVAIAVPNDVYLTYSIFVLTSRMRIVSFPLNLRTDSPESVRSEDVPQERSRLPPLADGPPAYVSLLTTKPFETPPILSRRLGLPSHPRLSLPTSPYMHTEIRVTPDTLRYLGAIVERFTAEVRDVHLAHRSLLVRTELQRQEFNRQQERTRAMILRIEEITGSRRQALEEKMKRIQAAQPPLLNRMDQVLQTLINKASPELNEHETKWFDELRRMKNQVLGLSRYDQSSLLIRVKMLQKEFDRLLPSLTELAKKEKERKAKLQATGIGFSQSFAYGKRSQAERVKLDEAVRQITKLAGKLDVTSLGKPPEPMKLPE